VSQQASSMSGRGPPSMMAGNSASVAVRQHTQLSQQSSAGPPSAMPSFAQFTEHTKVFPLKKPDFITINNLTPTSIGVNIRCRVVEVRAVATRPRPDGSTATVNEATVADSTASILLTARNDQTRVVTKGSSLVVRNGKIDMFRGHMRLTVDKWGLIELAPPNLVIPQQPLNTTIKLSDPEYELVDV